MRNNRFTKNGIFSAAGVAVLAVLAMSQNAAWALSLPAITSPATDTATVGLPFQYQISALNLPTAFTAVGLPAGLSLDPLTGLVYGTPTTAGTFIVGLGAANLLGLGSLDLTLAVAKGTPDVTWPSPPPLQYGAALDSQQLNATANLSGAFVYTPPAGTLLNAGLQTLSALFTPMDLVNYIPVTITTPINVLKQTPVITWNPADLLAGTPLGAAQLNASANVQGTFIYTPPAGTLLNAGLQTLSALFTPMDLVNYIPVTITTPINVLKQTPVITWNPADLLAGTPLGAAQLNASANVQGMFIYTPPAGTLLVAGDQQLAAQFTPVDMANYNSATAQVTLKVVPPLAVLSGPSATPNPAQVATPVQFSFILSQANGVTYSWNLGDGSTSTLSSFAHTYATPGTYIVTVSATAGSGSTVGGAVSVVVEPNSANPGSDDSDGDGFPDELEIAFGTNPLDPTSTLFGGQPAGTIQPLLITKMRIQVNFKRSGNDLIAFSGALPIPAGTSVQGKSFAVFVGGVVKQFTFNARASGRTDAASAKLTLRGSRQTVKAQMAKYSVTLPKGDFVPKLRDEGLADNDTIYGAHRQITVYVVFNNALYRKVQGLTYNSRKNASGRSK